MRTITYLRDPHETRASIRQQLLHARHTAGHIAGTDQSVVSQLDASISLAARLFLMISIGDFGHSISIGQPITWGEGSLQNVIDDTFAPGTSRLESFRFSKIFTALNLERIAGIKICWTSNLADHLLMNDDEKTVTLFHCVTFLKLHQDSDWYVSTSLETAKSRLNANSAKCSIERRFNLRNDSYTSSSSPKQLAIYEKIF